MPVNAMNVSVFRTLCSAKPTLQKGFFDVRGFRIAAVVVSITWKRKNRKQRVPFLQIAKCSFRLPRAQCCWVA